MCIVCTCTRGTTTQAKFGGINTPQTVKQAAMWPVMRKTKRLGNREREEEDGKGKMDVYVLSSVKSRCRYVTVFCYCVSNVFMREY